jgi:hypothetical protein
MHLPDTGSADDVNGSRRHFDAMAKQQKMIATQRLAQHQFA